MDQFALKHSLKFMAGRAEFTIRTSQQERLFRIMRIMTGQTITAFDRAMYEFAGQDLIFHFFVALTAHMF